MNGDGMTPLLPYEGYRYLPVIRYIAGMADINPDPSMTEEEIRRHDLETKFFFVVKPLLIARYNLQHKRDGERAANISKLKYIPCIGGCGAEHANYIDPSRTHTSDWCCAECHHKICGYNGDQYHRCKLRDGEDSLL